MPANGQYVLFNVPEDSHNAIYIQGIPVSGALPGANQVLTYDAVNNVWKPANSSGGYPPDYASLTGSTFTGPVVGASNGGFTGSITRLAGGTPYIVAPTGNVIVITTGSLGQIIISGSGGSGGSSSSSIGAPIEATYLTLNQNAQLSAERVFTTGTGLAATDAGANSTYTLAINNNVVATVSGTTFTGPIVATTGQGITGSITKTAAGTSYLIPGAGITITSGSGSDSITITATGGSGTIAAPIEATYLTLNASAQLSAERVLTAGANIVFVDGGANSTLTIVNSGTVGPNAFVDQGSKLYTTSTFSHDSRGVFANTVGTDVFHWVSGTTGLTGSNAARKATVFGGDLMFSSSYQEQRPTNAPKVYRQNFLTQSVTSNATPFVAYAWQLGSGSTSVDLKATATSANVSQGGTFNWSTLFRNAAGTITQEGPVGGVSGGAIGTMTTGSWGVSIDNAGNNARVVLTGSAATTVTWGWTIDILQATP